MPPAAEEAPGAGGGRALWRAADRREAALLGHHSGPEEQGSPEQRGLSPMAPGTWGGSRSKDCWWPMPRVMLPTAGGTGHGCAADPAGRLLGGVDKRLL